MFKMETVFHKFVIWTGDISMLLSHLLPAAPRRLQGYVQAVQYLAYYQFSFVGNLHECTKAQWKF